MTYEVELWWTPLDLSARSVEASARTLSFEEAVRATQYRGQGDRARFVVVRATLRRLLGRMTGQPPEQVRLEVAPGGKPVLPGSSLRFSTSRSAEVALYATSWTMEVGVDVEAVRADADMDAIAARFFTPEENRALAAMDPGPRLRAAYQCWSCKEAYGKGTGEGLTGALGDLVVWNPERDSTTLGDWRIHPVDLEGEYPAAVAGRSLARWRPSPPYRL